MRNAIPCVVTAVIAALGCADTPLAQGATFVITGVDQTNSVTFCGPNAQAQQITFATDSGSATYNIAVSSQGNYLQTSPPPNTPGTVTTTPQTVFLSLSNAVGAFSVGTYTGSITITAPGFTTAIINTNLIIGQSSCSSGGGTSGSGLSANLSSLVFTGSSTRPDLVVTNTSGFNNVTIFGSATTNSGGNWLSIVNTSNATVVAGGGVNYSVTVSTANLVFGNTYTGNLNFSSSVGGNLQIPVTLNYGTSGGGGGGGILSVPASQSSLTATLAIGSGATSQIVNVTNSSNSTLLVNASATTSTGQAWLSVSPASQNIGSQVSGGFTVTINPAVLNGVANVYNGNVTFSGGGATLVVPVTLNYGTPGGGPGGNGILVVNPASISVTLGLGSPTSSTNLTIFNNSTVNSTLNVGFSTTTAQGWLNVSPNGTQNIGPGVTAFFTITINPTGLTFPGTYSGTITITDQTGTNGTIQIPVSLCYGTLGCTGTGSATLAATPNPLGINIPTGATVPQSASVTVTSLVGPVNITAGSAVNYLTVNPPFTSTSSSSSSAVFTVTVTPSLVPAGGASTSITFTPSSGTALVVPVNITVGAAASLSITPSQLSFAYQTGTAFPAPQNLTLSSGSPTGFTVAATTNSGGTWLVVSPQSGATAGGGIGATVTVSINPSGLSANTYTGQVTITNSGTGASQQIPVTLLVSNLPILAFGNSGTTFNYQFQSTTLPTQQSVQVTSSGNPLTFSASVTPGTGGNFLNVTPSSGTTPQTLALSLNATALAQLAPGTYTANVSVAASGSGNSPVTYPVTLNITNNVLLSASQSSLNFNYQIGQAQPTSQTVNITSTGAPLTYSVTASSNSASCPNFLAASPTSGTTNGTIAVTVNTTGLVAGTCTGQISIASSGAGNSPLTIPVNLYVSNSALLNVSPSAINITTQVGTVPANLIVPLTSTDPNNQLTFNVTIAPNSSFVLVGPTSGATPTNLTIGFNTAGLAAGTYTSSINITATGPSGTVANSPVTVPITVVVTSGATASASPNPLVFTQPFGSPTPLTQTLTVTSSTPGLTFSASSSVLSPPGGSWLSVTTTNNITPGSVTVTVNGVNLGQGTYSGVVTIIMPGAANSPLNVPVTLTIGAAQALVVSPASLSFSYQAGATTTPASQPVQVTSTSGSVAFTAVATGTPNFLTVSPAGANTPATLNIGLNQSVISTLTPGNYTGTVTLSALNLANQTISVSLTVTAAPAPSITTVVNSASLQPGNVSPGEIVTIFGANMGPATGIGLTLTSSGRVATTLGGTQVFFDSVAAPLIFVRADQINAIVPYEVAGRVTTNVTISRNGVTSTVLQQRVADTSPAIFSLNATATGSGNGNGQGAILNQNFSINSAANPAAKGSFVSIYATGEGALIPGVPTGSVTPASGPTFPKPSGNVSVTIGGIPATLAYAGEAPGLVSGVLQVNAMIPPNVASGNQQVVLTVGTGTNSQQTITVAVQ